MPFKIDELVKDCRSILKSAQKTAERGDRFDFICKFHDHKSVLSGAFSIDSSAVVELMIFGKGPTWSTVALKAVALSLNDEILAISVVSKLFTAATTKSSRHALSVGGVSFETVVFSDGQRLLKIKPAPVPPVKGEPLSLAEIIALPAAAKKKLTYAQASKALAEVWNQRPTLGIQISEFKNGLDAWVIRGQTQRDRIQSELNRDGDRLTLMLPDRTFLTADAPNDTHVYTVFIEGSARAVTEFWFCVEAAIAALRPGMSESQRQSIMRKLGSGLKVQPPDKDKEFTDDNIRFSYYHEGKSCTLLIGRADGSIGLGPMMG